MLLSISKPLPAIFFTVLLSLVPADAKDLGALHGQIVARVVKDGGNVDVALPGAEVRLKDAAGHVAQTVATNAAGRFRASMLPFGDYLACASATGFAESCTSKPILLNGDVALRELLVLAPKGPILHGEVRLADGDPAYRAANAAGQTAAAAEVSATDSAGHALGVAAQVNAYGDYLLTGVTPSEGVIVTARFE